jgi:hypothetical protein
MTSQSAYCPRVRVHAPTSRAGPYVYAEDDHRRQQPGPHRAEDVAEVAEQPHDDERDLRASAARVSLS